MLSYYNWLIVRTEVLGLWQSRKHKETYNHFIKDWNTADLLGYADY